MSSTYTTDEFEHPPADMPVGAHRKPPSRWRPVIPFLVILLVAPLLAWGFSYLLERREEDVAAQSEPEAVVVEEEPQSSVELNANDGSGQPSAAPAEPTQPEPEPEPEAPAAGVDYGTPVVVLNASGIGGYAGQVSETLREGGFADVVADNSSGWATEANTVFYTSPDQAETAHQVAALVGIDSVVENADATGGYGIVVLLLY